MYNQKVVEHFTNPRNIGEIPDANGVGTYGDPDCGDHLKIFIKVNRDIITEVKFKIFGCSTLIATTSMLTEMAQGKRLQEAKEISGEDIVNELGGLPQDKAHCARLSVSAFYFALQDYQKRKSLGWAR